MGSMSLFHWLIVMVVVLLLFGNRLPSVMRSLGRGVTEFKKGLEGGEEDEDEEEVLEKPKKKKKPAGEIEEKSNGSERSSKEKQAEEKETSSEAGE
jgi:sec-independent protein translocase protein TatA